VHPWWRDRCQVLANSKTQSAYLFPVHTMFRHDCPPSGESCKYATAPSKKKKTWRDSLSFDMLLSAVSFLVVAQSSSEIPEGLMNNPVYIYIYIYARARAHTHTHTHTHIYIHTHIFVFGELAAFISRVQEIILGNGTLTCMTSFCRRHQSS
jgi:hypothetical protein